MSGMGIASRPLTSRIAGFSRIFGHPVSGYARFSYPIIREVPKVLEVCSPGEAVDDRPEQTRRSDGERHDLPP